VQLLRNSCASGACCDIGAGVVKDPDTVCRWAGCLKPNQPLRRAHACAIRIIRSCCSHVNCCRLDTRCAPHVPDALLAVTCCCCRCLCSASARQTCAQPLGKCDGVFPDCQLTPKCAGTECRAAPGSCKQPALCDGTSLLCGDNPNKPNGLHCPW
jgi:hypothetical protein